MSESKLLYLDNGFINYADNLIKLFKNNITVCKLWHFSESGAVCKCDDLLAYLQK